MDRAYYITSPPPEAAQLQEARRKHWSIENGPHHVLEVSFAEDHCRIRVRQGAQNANRLRGVACNLIKQAQARTKRKGIKRQRALAGWSHGYLPDLFNPPTHMW